MIRRSWEALVCDLDGTLVTEEGTFHPRTLAVLSALSRRGVRVMLATGRSEGGIREPLAALGLETPAVVYNGGGVYCPLEKRLVEERLLSNALVEEVLGFCAGEGVLAVTMRAGEKFVEPPREPVEAEAVRLLEDLRHCEAGALPRENLMRITLFSRRHGTSAELAARVAEAIGQRPSYLTHFPLDALPAHRRNPLQVVDVQPPCRGKGEALRLLEERYGIPAERVVAVGDAENDLPMIELAGLGVAVSNAMPSVLAVADRVIGDHNTDTIAELALELFGEP